MTYVQAYSDDLERAMEKGGDLSLIERAIAEYNTFDPSAFERWWHAHASFPCSTCGGTFKTTTAPSATSYITCGTCAK